MVRQLWSQEMRGAYVSILTLLASTLTETQRRTFHYQTCHRLRYWQALILGAPKRGLSCQNGCLLRQ